jgi:hypothetical protein
VSKALDYWDRAFWGKESILQVVVVYPECIYVSKAEEEGGVYLYDMEFHSANRGLYRDRSYCRGGSNAKLNFDHPSPRSIDRYGVGFLVGHNLPIACS